MQQAYYSPWIFKSLYRQFLMQSLISNVEVANSSYTVPRSVSVLDAVNWIRLAVKKIKAERVKSGLLKLGLGKVMWQIIWRRRVKTLLQYLISAEENNFPVMQRPSFRVMTI
jgi:hypothetical protein